MALLPVGLARLTPGFFCLIWFPNFYALKAQGNFEQRSICLANIWHSHFSIRISDPIQSFAALVGIILRVRSQAFIVRFFPRTGRTHCGTSFIRQRHDDSGSLLSTTKQSRKPEGFGINPKIVAKWKPSTSIWDRKTGPKTPAATALRPDEEAIIVVSRRQRLPPSDDWLYAFQPPIPHMSRSSLHRCLHRHGIRRLPDVDGDKPAETRCKRDPSKTSMSIWPRLAPQKASAICLWQWTEHPNAPSRAWCPWLARWPRHSFCAK